MGNITLGEIANVVIGLSAFITAGVVLVKYALAGVDKLLKPFNERIDKIEKNNKDNFRSLQLQTDKNYLVRFLADVEQGSPIDETELEHFWYTYDDYHNNNGNSYIDHKVDRLKKEGKL